MAQKPRIQYVGEFFLYGSEAPKVAPKPKKTTPKMPTLHLEKLQKIYIDPLALCCVLVAVGMMTVLLLGAFHMKELREQYDAAQEQLMELKRENASLSHAYHTRYDLEEIRANAEKMGMIDAKDADRFTVRFSVPVPEEEPTAWDEFIWFLSGLFSNAKRS